MKIVIVTLVICFLGGCCTNYQKEKKKQKLLVLGKIENQQRSLNELVPQAQKYLPKQTKLSSLIDSANKMSYLSEKLAENVISRDKGQLQGIHNKAWKKKQSSKSNRSKELSESALPSMQMGYQTKIEGKFADITMDIFKSMSQ